MQSHFDDGQGTVLQDTPEAGAPSSANILHGDENWRNWRVLMNLIIIGLALGLFGYDNAVSSPLISLPLFVEKYQGSGPIDGALAFTARNLDLLIPVPLVGAAFGPLGAIFLQKLLGRKMSLLLAYLLCCIPGSILQLFAPNMEALVVGRFWNSFGIGILANIAPLYLSEIVPVKDRAKAVGFTIAGSGAVSVIATVVVWASAKINDSRQYKLPLIVQAVLPVLFFTFTFAITESPIWLLSKGRVEEARASLSSFRSGNIRMVDKEMAFALLSLRSHNQTRAEIKISQILKRPHLERTISAGALLCLSQVGGQILVGTYSTVILVQSGIADPFKITIIIFLLQFLGTVIGPIFVDRIGRRPIALTGFIFLFAIDMIAGALACAGLTTHAEKLAFASLCMIFAFINAVSFSSLAYVLPTEIPTAQLREPTVGWAFFWSTCTAIVTTFVVPQITSPTAGNLGAKAFLLFGGCMAVTIIWAYFYLPETVNRTLAEIDELYASGLPKRQWKGYKSTVVSISVIDELEMKAGATHEENTL